MDLVIGINYKAFADSLNEIGLKREFEKDARRSLYTKRKKKNEAAELFQEKERFVI